MRICGVPVKVWAKVNINEARREATQVIGLIPPDIRRVMLRHLRCIIWYSNAEDPDMGVALGNKRGAIIALNADALAYGWPVGLRYTFAHELRHVWQMANGYESPRKFCFRRSEDDYENYLSDPCEIDATIFAHNLVGGASAEELAAVAKSNLSCRP